MTMRSAPLRLIGAVIGILATTCAMHAASGTLTWDATEAQIKATDGWQSTYTSMYWLVGASGNATYPWRYVYEFTIPSLRTNLSHLIIEVSESFTQDDLNYTGGEIGWHSSANGNPGMPGSVFGLNIPDSAFTLTDNGDGSATYAFSFFSTRSPVWGDFWAKDGTADQGQTEVWACNAGFELHDSNDGAHIMVPDTKELPPPNDAPEPAAWILLLSASALSAAVRRRRG
ncbi:MAG: hypothetical protein AB7Y46_14630 [Armatimonadota bacterium]